MELYQFILAMLVIGLIAKVLSLAAMILSIRQRRKEQAQMGKSKQ